MTLYITIGIPGSGKSTWVNKVKKDGDVVVSPDLLRKKLTGSINDQSKNKEVFQTAHKMLKTACENALVVNKNVFWDATSVKSKDRKTLLEIVKESRKKGLKTVAVVFKADKNISKKRIKEDIENEVERSNVPDFVVDKMYCQLMGSKGITLLETEGFDSIEYV